MVGLAALLAMALAPSAALSVDPNAAVAGSGKAWFEGDIMSQSGLNCTLLGGSYSEIMVQGSGSYGGLAGIPAVNQAYWVSFLVSVPGNPCGPGSSVVSTDLLLPAGTSYDSSRPIRCFGKPRSANDFSEITNETWSLSGSSGRYCPTTAGLSTSDPAALNFGYRPLASGQMFQIFVPVRSTQALSGIAGGHVFRWYSTATGVYENPGWSRTWMTVLSSPSGGSPQFIESRTGALPFWKPDAATSPNDTRSRVETWVNLYTAGLGGTLCFEIRRQSDNFALVDCTQNAAYGLNTSVAAGIPVVQVLPGAGASTGPSGGWAPYWFASSQWGRAMNFIWRFTPTGGGAVVTKTLPFTVLSGADRDGDGVADTADACPDAKGTLANGCLPAPQEDGDRDGVYGAADLCPAVAGGGAFNGCPGGVVPAAPTSSGQQETATPTPSRAGPVAAPARAALRSGIALRVTAGAGGVVRASGSIPAAAARKAGVPTVVATGVLRVRKAGQYTVRLVAVAAARAKARKLAGVTMTVSVRIPGRPGTSKVVITLR